ncbi:MAG: hypothetical protein EOO38_06855 [Cytophagaceae bacterium]|nr:MAG: hypothetical protein EOO38_06855 [Cytophagaceae bacterium]
MRDSIMDVTAKADQIAPSAPQVTGAKRKFANCEGAGRKKKQALPPQEKDLIESEHNTSDSEDDAGLSIKDIVRVPHPVLTTPRKVEEPSPFLLQYSARMRNATSGEEFVAMHREATGGNLTRKVYNELTEKQKSDLRKEIKEADESGRFVPRKPRYPG